MVSVGRAELLGGSVPGRKETVGSWGAGGVPKLDLGAACMGVIA